MFDYYSDKLSADRLVRVYDLATPRVVQYLEAEIAHVRSRLGSGGEVLELGCGYGRVLNQLVDATSLICGIDTSRASLDMARTKFPALAGASLAVMDASRLALRDAVFDVVVCIQNGISAFYVDQATLICEALRVTRRGGRVMFSSYSDRIWSARLDWFYRQAAAGLLGEIDPEQTGDGTIVCRDGFTATTVRPDDFRRLCATVGVVPEITEIDQSSVFCEILKA